ncbi:tricarballylate dehydrogenase [Streptomonospora nanhaiensis]|uniref:Tricarballylate dehydrogenase n=1 Tax=Streptomonospora nanhaiensis TaxID=1323731 RepID=A0A853BPH5_9ACTN|nr:FAD-dependent tricarballylate dehydrogenase TcuA [Streptomonospora nanhaiensis]NYI97348.1 tricarballylate dehydrogenase [Streptomonospora nanhaiensis]
MSSEQAGDASERDGAEYVDVVVVGGGNAGFCAAHAAAEGGARVLVLEKGPRGQEGGNSFYTAGAFRVVHPGAEGVAPIVDEATRERLADTSLAPYTERDFTDDMVRVTEGRCDPEMTRTLVGRSWDTVQWLHAKGVRWRLMYERQSYLSQGRWTFFGGLALGVVDGGKGLVAQHTEAALAEGVEIRYGAAVADLVRRPSGGFEGVVYTDEDGARRTVRCAAVVLAAGGFESNPTLRRRHLGDGWERAVVRGNPLNTGEVLELAIARGAAAHGDWSSCHSVAWDAGAPPQGGDRELTNQRTRQSYPIGIVVDRDGLRFLDEGADYRNYTYAKYGREFLKRPGGVAFQLFDAKTRPLLRTEEYDSTPITGAQADSLEELAAELGIDAKGLAATVEEFNTSIVDVPFDPAVKDGRAARVDPPKSNWAQPLDTPPYYGFAVTCGITFTFGGLHVDGRARVLGEDGAPLEGLYAAGEIVGGLFSGNYPGGSGLTAGAVYGRLAGEAAAEAAVHRRPN